MSRAHRLSVTSLALIAAVPLAWFACGGESKPPESPASESSATPSSAEPAASEAPASSGSAAASDTSAAPTATSEATAAAAPPPPSFGSTDCGKCVDKTCSKQAAACGKDTDCQVALDTIHSCSQSGAACVEAATPPSAAKAKKLAAAYEACGKKAAAKACKAQCK
jgi:hypothetical protein